VTAYHSTHLKQLEVESIQIISEVATEFEWLASKASIVMLQLARKEFFPESRRFRCCTSTPRVNFARCLNSVTDIYANWA